MVSVVTYLYSVARLCCYFQNIFRQGNDEFMNRMRQLIFFNYNSMILLSKHLFMNHYSKYLLRQFITTVSAR